MSKEVEFIDPVQLIIVGLDTDHAEGAHPLYDQRAFLETDEALIKNIMAYGVQVPVIVRREAGQIVVVDGRQRVKASREAAKRQSEAGSFAVKVPVMEAQGDDKRLVGIMNLTNENRTPTEMLEKCFNAVRMRDMGADVDEIAITFGRSKTTIKGWFDLASASPKIHAALKSGKVSTSAATQIAKLGTREEQETELEKLLGTGERVSEAKAKKARREAAGTSASSAGSAAAAPEAVEGGAPELGADPKGPKGKGKGKGAKGKSKKEVITTASGSKRTTARQAVQSGIKRTWIRKALKSDAAKSLSEDQLAVLAWFAYGKADKGTWYDEFTVSAELEMGEASVG
jgi:ParB family chromosome partitioning protein